MGKFVPESGERVSGKEGANRRRGKEGRGGTRRGGSVTNADMSHEFCHQMFKETQCMKLRICIT